MPITLPHSIIHVFDNVITTRYVSAAGFTILVYDSLLTLADEIRLLWFERWTLVKTLFYLNRFISIVFVSINTYVLSGFAPALSRTTCQILLLTTGYAAIFAFAIGNYLLLCRATALWGGTRKIVWGMTLFFLVSYVATISTATVASLQLAPGIFFSKEVHTCAVSLRPTTFGAIWIPSVIFEVILFLMLFIKLFQHAGAVALATPRPLRPHHQQQQQSQQQLHSPIQPQSPQHDIRRHSFLSHTTVGGTKLSKLQFHPAKIAIPEPVKTVTFLRRSPSKILHTLYKDGFLYFVVILGLRVFNLIAWAAMPISLIFIGIFILWSFTTVLLTRMHLNLKAIGSPRSRSVSTSTSTSSRHSVHRLRRLDLKKNEGVMIRPNNGGGGGGADGLPPTSRNLNPITDVNREEGDENGQRQQKQRKRKIGFRSGRISPAIAFRRYDSSYEDDYYGRHPYEGPREHDEEEEELDEDDRRDHHQASHAFTHGGLSTFTIDVSEEELWSSHPHPQHQHIERVDGDDESEEEAGGGVEMDIVEVAMSGSGTPSAVAAAAATAGSGGPPPRRRAREREFAFV